MLEMKNTDLKKNIALGVSNDLANEKKINNFRTEEELD